MEKRGYSTEGWLRNRVDPTSPLAVIQEAKDEIEMTARFKEAVKCGERKENE